VFASLVLTSNHKSTYLRAELSTIPTSILWITGYAGSCRKKRVYQKPWRERRGWAEAASDWNTVRNTTECHWSAGEIVL